jgi:glycosyltransferase involved in cell wall biosynthesis
VSKSQPLVSVVVPTRDSAKTLAACLQSIRAQVYQPIELIVVDNGSTDKTVEIAAAHAARVEPFGPERSAQRNRGAQLAKGDYLLFIDSDMKLTPDVVGDCLEIVKSTGALAVVIPELSEGEGFVAHCRQLERSCYVGDDAIEAARFFSRPVFETSGGFDENLTGPEDWDLTAKIGAGRSLPRTASFILHDEGRLRLTTLLAKKRYYAPSFIQYWRKQGRSTARQSNLVLRPAFFRNWRRFVRHPILGIGVLTIKSLEALAAVSGLVEIWVKSQTTLRRDRP